MSAIIENPQHIHTIAKYVTFKYIRVNENKTRNKKITRNKFTIVSLPTSIRRDLNRNGEKSRNMLKKALCTPSQLTRNKYLSTWQLKVQLLPLQSDCISSCEESSTVKTSNEELPVNTNHNCREGQLRKLVKVVSFVKLNPGSYAQQNGITAMIGLHNIHKTF